MMTLERISLLLLLALVLAGCGKSTEEGQQAGSNEATQSNSNGNVSDQRPPLLRAVESGDKREVQSLLDKGENVNAATESGVTPLMNAAGMGYIEIARALLEKGADVNAKSPGGYTALMSAALNGRAEMVRLLLDAGADPSMADISGKTAADIAKDKKHDEIVIMLKQKR